MPKFSYNSIFSEKFCNDKGQCVPNAEKNKKKMSEQKNPTPLSRLRMESAEGIKRAADAICKGNKEKGIKPRLEL